MKNIHLIPTTKEQHAIIQKNTGLLLVQTRDKVYTGIKLNIYITSDEEMKEGDWVVCWEDNYKEIEVVKLNKNNYTSWINSSENYRKIILTTDKQLIAAGVQAIDDEFLEWFVKNPNCEKVETIYGLFNPMGRQVEPNNLGQNHSKCVWKYKIIIPKEEPKHPRVLSENGNELFFDEEGKLIKEETLEEVDYLQGFINQFEENGEHQELSNDDWTVSQFLTWLKLNNYKIIKNKII